VEFVIFISVLAAAALLITAPFRRGWSPEEASAADVAALQAAKEAKLQEIRDAELDFRTGKLSEADYKILDRALRGEAIDVLRRLDGARGVESEAGQR
jgi:uncharacterized protein